MKRIVVIVLLLLAGWSVRAQGQLQTLKQNIDFHIDALGDAHVAVTMKLNASQWKTFKRTMGNNVALLKRNMERALPGYFLTDFKYDEDAMNRSYTLKFDALGVSKVDQQGRWIAELDTKSPDVTKISDHLYLINSTMGSGGALIEQYIKVFFPESASDIKVDKDAFGNAYFSFVQPRTDQRSKLWLVAGVFLLLAGFGWGALQLKKG